MFLQIRSKWKQAIPVCSIFSYILQNTTKSYHFMKVFTLMKRRVKLGIFLKVVWKQEEKSGTGVRAEAGLKMRLWRESEEELVSEKT